MSDAQNESLESAAATPLLGETTQPAPSTDVVSIATRPFKIVVLEGVLYFLISALPPLVMLLESDKILSTRGVFAAILAGFVSGCISLKAFFSQSTAKK